MWEILFLAESNRPDLGNREHSLLQGGELGRWLALDRFGPTSTADNPVLPAVLVVRKGDSIVIVLTGENVGCLNINCSPSFFYSRKMMIISTQVSTSSSRKKVWMGE